MGGMFWMNWDDFRARFSDLGVVPKSMEVPRVGHVEGEVEGTQPQAKHGKKFNKDQPAAPAPSPAIPAPVILTGSRITQPTPRVVAQPTVMAQSRVTTALPTVQAAPISQYGVP